MSESNNNIPMRITQLEEATAYEDGMFYAVAKVGGGTKKIACNIPAPNPDFDFAFETGNVPTDISDELVWVAAYINGDGKLISSTASQCAIVPLKKGEKIIVGTKNTYITIIGSTTADTLAVGDTVTVIQMTSGIDQFETYSYQAPQDMNVTICVLASNYILKVYKESQLKKDLINDIDDAVSPIKEHFEIKAGKNLFNKDDPDNLYGTSSSNCYLLNSSGVPYNSTSADANYSVSCFVPVESGKTIFFSSGGNQTYVYQLATFNEQKQFLSITTWVGSYAVPNGVSFIRVSAVKLPDSFQIEYGYRSSYEPYIETTFLKDTKVKSSDIVSADEDVLVLPSKFYGVQNKEYDIFFKNVIKGNFRRFILGQSGTGQMLSRRIRYIISTAGTTNTNLNIYDEKYNQVQTKTISYVNADANSHSGETLKVLAIGDSFINSGYITYGLIKDFENDAASLQLLGTLGTAPNLHEGRSGWSSYEYTHESSVSSVPNPFYKDGTFDFEHYVTTNNIETPDYVIINLGINDGWKDMHNTTTAQNLKTMIDSIHEYSSSIKIIVGTTPSPYLGDDGENGYLCMLLANRRRQNITLNVLENITEDTTTFICPIHLNFDTDYNFNMSTITKNGENDGTLPFCSDDTHPSHMGFYQIADSYFACIKAN